MKLKLINKKPETPDVTTLVFQPESPLTWLPGQFLHYTLHHEPTDDRGSDRWFTVSSAPFEDEVHITTRFNQERPSSFKKALEDLKEGEEIEAEGPEGDFTVDDPDQSHVFIAGGIGITPYRSILKQLDHDGKKLNIQLLYANKSKDNVPFKVELDELSSKHPEFKINYIFDPEKINEETVRKYTADLETPVFYVSGPEPMVEALGDTLRNMGVPEDRLRQDFFPGYPAE